MTILLRDPTSEMTVESPQDEPVFVLPASYAQQRLWFLDRLEPGSPLYNIPFALRLTGALDADALAWSLGEIVRRHEVLRTSLAMEDGEVVQIVSPPPPHGGWELPRISLERFAAEERWAEACRLAVEEATRPFDLARGPLFRALLVSLGSPQGREEHLLCLNLHHTIADGWSLGVLQRELEALYRARFSDPEGEPSPLDELAIQYGDFAAWQREELSGSALESHLAWWRERLGDAPRLLELPLARPHPAVRDHRGEQRQLALPRDLSDSLKETCRREGVTRFMALLAAFATLLHRTTGQDDLVIGMPLAGREQLETEELIGFFANVVALRLRVTGDGVVGGAGGEPAFRDLLARVREGFLGAHAHQDLPFERLVEELQPERSLSHPPLVQVLFTFHETAPLAAPDLPGLGTELLELGTGTVKFDLTLSFEEREGCLLARLFYAADLLDGIDAERLLVMLRSLLAGGVAGPERPLSRLPILTEEGLHQCVSEWNDNRALFRREATLPARFSAQARATPGALALVAGDERLTYRELDTRARRLARRLRGLGVGPEVRVGVALERTPRLVVALLAVLEAGGAYVPLDPAYPRERLAFILADAQEGQAAPVLLTERGLLERLPAFAGTVLCLDEEGFAEQAADAEAADSWDGAGTDNLAYLIYTSGSTGRPKGVAIEHRSAAALLDWAAGAFTSADLSRTLAATSITFDLSVYELFLPLTTGGAVVLAEDALALPHLPAAGEVRLVNTVPSAIAALVRTGGVPAGVRTVNLAGEPLRRALVDELYALPGVEKVYNLYGPSEDTTYSTWVLVPRADSREPTIGAPIANTQAYVVDRWLGVLPAGMPGELCLGGEGLARGYLNRPELTAERFAPDPFGGLLGKIGSRLYRTGDLARRRVDGELEFLGRIDHQVKVRGFRIELGEIEAALLAHPEVREAVVLARQEDGGDEPGEKRLVAYFAPAGTPAADLRSHLLERLPQYMVPAVFVGLAALPLTPNGKVDRKALPAPEETLGEEEPAAPRTPVEELLAGIWCEVLRRGDVGTHDNFFSLGGHSLRATQVMSRVRDVYGVELPLRRLFESPTVAALAAEIEAARRGPALPQAPPLVPVPRVSRDSDPPASFAQERLWFLDRFGADPASYNIPTAVLLRGRLDTTALAASLDELGRRHESLRTTFAVAEDRTSQVVQVIHPPLRRGLPLVDLSGLPAADPAARRLAREEARRKFDLERGPLIRTALLRLAVGGEEHALLLSMHHIVSDGWSVGVFVRELGALYAAFASGLPSPLPEPALQYADFAHWQRRWLQGKVLESQLDSWRRRLAGAPQALELPTDRPRPPVQSASGGRWPLAIPALVSERLQALSRRQGVTLFMTLLAGFAALLHRVTGGIDLPVGTAVANRNRAETEGLIGFFINNLVLRVELAGDPAFTEALRRVRAVALEAYAHQDLPFEKLVAELQPERDLSRSPLFQVMLILQNAPIEPLALPGLTAAIVPVENDTSKLDLVANLGESPPGLAGVMRYNRDLFDAATVARLAGHYETLLAAAAEAPGLPLSALPLLGGGERQQLLLEWNDTEDSWPLEQCLHERIAQQAGRMGGAIAVECEGITLSYRDLDIQANRLAHHLRRLGAGPESRVGIAVERSLEMVVGLLAILKAGAAYVPLDPSYPRDRLAFMLEDSQKGELAPVLLTQERLAQQLPPHRGHVLLLDSGGEAWAGESGENPATGVLPEHPAYMIYTSGSTGRPKGAVNTHRAIVNRLLWMQQQYGLTEEDRVLQKTPFSFDVSVWEFFWPLLTGARLVVARPGGHQDSAYLVAKIADAGITTLHFVPSMLQVFVEQPGVERCTSLVRVFCSGEALPFELQQRFFVRLGGLSGGPALHNLYGPTEAAVDVTAWACERASARPVVPIGRPIANLRIHLLDAGLGPVPIGVPGELHIGGVGLFRGYLGRPELTAEKLIPDPFASGGPGSRLYKSGDLARHLPHGGVDFLGRLDHQVKVRGFRIELGEIEGALAAHPAVREVVVVARDDVPGKRLVAYLVAAGGADPSPAELREALAGRLPEYMVPATFVVLPALPLSPNGKVDRRALPAPEAPAAGAERAFVAPGTELERYLAGLWQEALGLAEIGVHDNFFDLGGSSITGAILINRLQEKLGEIVHVVVIFDAPTVDRMARTLTTQYPQAVARLWGSGGTDGAGRADGAGRPTGRIDAAEVAAIRALIPPLPPFATGEPRNPPAVFVLSPPRSGSTLLRVMLAGHPELFAPPELELLVFNTLRERKAAYSGRDSFSLEGLVRAVMEIRGYGLDEAERTVTAWEEGDRSVRHAYRQMQEWLGSRRLVDKTPSYPLDLEVLRRAETDFADALYIHLVRHPRAMVRSFDEARLEQVFFRQKHPFSRRELAELIWLVCQENIRRFEEEIPAGRWHRIHFEDLLREPEETLRGICGFLGIDYHPAMALPYEGREEGRSRRMTDGLHAESRMLGDVKFHSYSGIDATVAEKWRDDSGEDFLGEPAARMAAALGYEVAPGRADSGAIPRLDRRPDEPVALSFAQERLWFLAQIEPESSFYNIPSALRLTGTLDVPALAWCLAEIRRRHAVLSSVFAATPEGPVQRAAAPAAAGPPGLAVIDLGALFPTRREVEAARLTGAEARRAFDLEAGPPLRATLLRLSPREHALLATFHHIVADGWSLGLFMAELAALYAAALESRPSPLPEPPIQYADFAVWQRARLSGDALAGQLSYWRSELAGAPAMLELPTDRPRPAIQRFRGGQVPFALDQNLTARLLALGRRQSATPFMTLLAAFQALLSRYAGQDDVVVGSPTAGRSWPETESLIGFFVNTLVLRSRFADDPAAAELVACVRRTVLDALAHQELPFEKLVEELQPQRSLTHSPLFQVMFVFQNAPRRPASLPGLEVSTFQAAGGTAKFDLNLSLGERGGRLAGVLEVDSDLFDATTAARLLAAFMELLRGLADNPERRVSELPLLTPAERQQLREHNDAAAGIAGAAAGLCLHRLIEMQADLAPDAETLICGTERLTRGDLDRRANRLAHCLRRLGVGPEVRVSIALERSADLVVALLAVLKAGGAYVPLDPAYPAERLALILEDAQRGLPTPLLLTQEGLLDRLPESSSRVLCLDRDRARIERESASRLEVAVDPGNLAYLIYTSGSTGRPKGVAIEHRSAAALLAWATEVFTPAELSGVLASTSITFDLSIFELFLPLARGGLVILADNALALPDLPAAGEVRLINTVPSAMTELVRLGAVPSSVLTVNLAGEPLRRILADDLYALPHVERVYNLYGPSEDTTYSTWTRVPAGTASEPTIGRPIQGTRAYVVDRWMVPQPAGVPGELVLAGAGLARGYLHRPELTAERFIPDPFGSDGCGERLYRTGDRVRRRPDGELEFLGRFDHQVKVRGFRIELGEIETALLAHPAVREAVVLASGEGGEKRLTAYLESSGDGGQADFRGFLAATLPDYMVPAGFVLLDALPRTPNGKVDRRALARIEPERGAVAVLGGVSAPRSPVEELLAGIWAEVLRCGTVGSGDDFFALGGHSLLAVRVAARVREVFSVELALRSLFETPTLAGLAAHVERARRAARSQIAPPPLIRADRSQPLPASFAQERLWFLDRFGVTGPAYHLTTALRLRGDLDPGALAAALSALVRRHEALRTSFAVMDGEVVQAIAPPGSLPLPVLDLRPLPTAARERELRRLAAEEARRLFDLARGPVVRATLVALAGEEHALLLAMHHIASDGWSMQVLLRELPVLYAGGELPALPIQYADYARWQRRWLQGEALAAHTEYWRRQMEGAPGLLALPLDRPRPAVQSFRGARRRAALPARLADELNALGRRCAVSPFMTLLAAFQALLARCTGVFDVPVGSPVANRDRIETEGVVGFFVNTLVLRTSLADDPPFTGLVRRVRDVVLDAHAHQDLPFEKLVEELRPERDLSHAPLFQVMLLLHPAGEPEVRFPGLALEALDMDSGTAKLDLLLAMAPERHGDLLGMIEYSRDLFDAPTIDRLLASFATLLTAAAADPSLPVTALPLLPAAVEQQIVREWNDTAAPFPRRCLHEPFQEHAARTPEAPAVFTREAEGEERLSYGELDRRANRLAWHLRRLGVGRGSLVAVHLDRGAGMIAAVLAVHKAGGAYVPLETSWPAERIHGILSGQRIAHAVTSEARRGVFEGLEGLNALLTHVICLEDDLAGLPGLPDTAPPAIAGPDDLAYIIFTSGSTGQPKGVMVRHAPAANLVAWVNRKFEVGPGDRLLFVANLSFDLSVYDIFGTLAAGAAVRVASAAEQRDPQSLAQVLCREPITFWDSAPAALRALEPYFPPAGNLPAPPALRLVFLSGDWIPLGLPERVRETFPAARVISLGGATEATIWSNWYPVETVEPGWASIPYGRPIDNARYHVVDVGLAPSPVGVAGDLYIGGSCLSDGYAASPDLTAGKYVPDPFGGEPGARLYSTGDRARYWPDGNLEFLGRVDTQVKVRGFRIELGEIESVLCLHPAVREAVVLAREDTPGDQRLVAYVIPKVEPAPAPLELRRFVQLKLPEYMVPAAFVLRYDWPLSPTGKLDRKALPAPEAPSDEAEGSFEPPRDEMETRLAAIWCEVIGRQRVSVTESFFDAGGHSLLMARVHSRLEETLGRRLPLVELFQHPTIRTLVQYLRATEAGGEPKPAAELKPVAGAARPASRGYAIAVVGMAGRFPGARSVDELWRNLLGGVESIRFFSDDELIGAGFPASMLKEPQLVKARGALADPDLFDAAFFDFPPREAQIMDPQQRLFLECAWEALEHAGHGWDAHRGRVGVYAGVTENTYVQTLWANPDLIRAVGRQQIAIANNHDYLPTRVSYKLNLRGPSINVQTACSTSLVAVHLACVSLLHGDCDLALAGGASIQAHEVTGYLYHEGGISSPDGHTRTFDASARGVVGGSGVGVVVLKRLEDALADGDAIHAVIRGSASNNDGTAKVGFTAPSVEGQAAAIRTALERAGVDPATVRYVEAHGTGTPMGDPIEVAALNAAFSGASGSAAVSCALGSIKTNIGHLDAASGISGLIKAVLTVREGTIPPSLHFERPNPKIDFGPFHVNTRAAAWPADGHPRRAGVSSFGIGGTNAHVILEEAPAIAPSDPPRRLAQLLVLAAKTATALDAATANLAGHLAALPHPEDRNLADAAFTLAVGRQPFRHRRMLVCREAGEAADALRRLDPARVATGSPGSAAPGVAFLFPGQGAQFPGMAEELYRTEPVFRDALDRTCELFLPELGFDLRELLFPDAARAAEAGGRLERTEVTQPALFAVEHALARLWMAWGVKPAAMLGHSIGEYAAACLAGVFSLEDGVRLVAARGRLMQQLPPGDMLAVPLPEKEVRALVAAEPGLSLAAVNSPISCVVSGPPAAVTALEASLAERGLETRRLHTSHAFHSAMMDPILEPFTEIVRHVELSPPRVPYLSNLTGSWISAETATDPAYWARHLREPVRFADGLGELLRQPGPALLEVGPGRTLSTLVRQHPDRGAARTVVRSLRHARERQSDVEQLLGALGRLWLESVEVDWPAFHAGERRRRVPLPTYPFERQRYWVEEIEGIDGGKLPAGRRAAAAPAPPAVSAAPARRIPATATPLQAKIAAVWRDLLGVGQVRAHDDFFDLGGSSLMAVQLGSRLRQALGVALPSDFLLQAPTVEALEGLVEELRESPEGGQAERPRSSLVRLQAGSSGRRPLFMVHQVGGHVFTFRNLARELGADQPLYGLRSQGLEGSEEPLQRVEEMAALYLELVRGAQPAGPYLIGGASMGGMVAFEMAHQLHAAGEEVELLALMDTPCLDQMPARPGADGELVAAVFAGRVTFTREELASPCAEELLAHAVAKAKTADPAGGLELDEARRLFRVLKGNIAALFDYAPKPWPGRMLFFRAERRRPNDPARPELPWIELARGGIEIRLVTGDHETMHTPPHVRVMAERLASFLGSETA